MLSALQGAAPRSDGVQVVYRGAHGETRAGLVMPLPGAITAPIEIPPRALLSLGYAFQAAAFMTETPELAEPGRVRVAFVDADGGKETVLAERRIDLRANKADRRWFDERIDLAALAGRKGTLALAVINEGDAEKAKGTSVYFSTPRILQRPEDGAAPAPGLRNVVLITIDCLRAGHVGAYGYDKPTTPSIDRLAKDGMRFANAFANAPMTLPSIPQLFTSTVFPTKDVETLLEPVGKAGIPSAAVVNNAWIPLWLSQGKHAEPPGTFDVMMSGELDAKAITDRALTWLDRHQDDRFVLYLHYLDAHTPYAPPKEYVKQFADPAYAGKIGDTFAHVEGADASGYDAADRKKVMALYDAALKHIDTQIGRLVATLGERGQLDDTVIVVAADHGEEFWDHGNFFHGQSLYDELLHIPLIVRAPGAAPAGTVIERPVRMIDVAPSLLEWAALERPATFEGRPLSQTIASPAAAGDDLIATATQAQFPTRYAIRSGGLKLIESLDTGKRELFDVTADPHEEKNLAAQRPDDLAKLEARLAEARAPLRARGYQVRVVGPASGSAALDLKLESQPRSGTFLTLDRTSPFGAPKLALSTNGENLTAQATVDARGTGFRFDRLLSPRNIARDDKLKLVVTADGKPVPLTAIALGKDGAAPASDVIDITTPGLTSATEPPCAAPESGVRVCVWRFPGEQVAAMPEIKDPAVREKLRALGYLQ
jgi:arylsulfatase